MIGAAPVGVLDEDLRHACLEALSIPRQACVDFAALHTWQASARVFIDRCMNVRPAAPDGEGEAFEFGAEEHHFAALPAPHSTSR